MVVDEFGSVKPASLRSGSLVVVNNDNATLGIILHYYYYSLLL